MYKHTLSQVLDTLEDLRDLVADALEGDVNANLLDEAVGNATDLLNANHPEVEKIHAIADHLLTAADGTYSLAGTPMTYNSGYQVGGVVSGLVSPSRKDLILWVERVRAAFPMSRSVFWGVWVDPATGLRYIDLSDRNYKLLTARLTARRRDEIAIWDWEAGEAIEVQP